MIFFEGEINEFNDATALMTCTSIYVKFNMDLFMFNY